MPLPLSLWTVEKLVVVVILLRVLLCTSLPGAVVRESQREADHSTRHPPAILQHHVSLHSIIIYALIERDLTACVGRCQQAKTASSMQQQQTLHAPTSSPLLHYLPYLG